MSTTVDERVVSMQFDNAQFEKGVQQTLQSLNNLDASINRASSQNGQSFNGLMNALSNVDHKISNGILPTMETVNNKFSVMGVFADQWIRNISTSVQGFIHKTLDGLFQIRGGMNEYELKMGSIQTIMNGTGESLETVTKKLDELNTYSDQTIYSFKDMTDNIGKFTNQGVKLDSAVNAIKGIANEAALSGANAMQASHAMYNFAQAMSAGYVKLIDWKSIENSMMATVGFKQALLDTAEALGTVVKQGDDYITTTTNAQGKVSDLFNAQKGFNDSLQNQWMTNEVLTQALEFYATDVRKLNDVEKEAYETKLRNLGLSEKQIKNFEELGIKAANAATEIKTFSMLVDTVTEAIGSGWAKTFEIIFGDFNEAKALWTGIGTALGNVVDSFSDARNNFLQMWKDAGGRTALLQSFVNILNAIDAVLRPIGQAFRDVFGSLNGNIFADMTIGLANFLEKLILTNGQMEKIREVATVVFTVLKNVLSVLWAYKEPIAAIYLLVKAFTTLKMITATGLGLSSIFGILKMIVALGLAVKLLGLVKNLRGVVDIIKKIGSSPLFQNIKSFTFNVLDLLITNVKKLFSYLQNSKTLNSLGKNISYIGYVISEAITKGEISFDTIRKIGDGIHDVFVDLTTWARGGLTAIKEFFTVAKTGSDEVGASLNNVTEPIKKTSGIFDTVSASLGNLFGCFNMVAYAAEQTEKPTYQVVDGMLQLVDATKDSTEAIEEQRGPLDGHISALQEWLNKLADVSPAMAPFLTNLSTLVNGLRDAQGPLATVFGFILDVLSKIDWGRVLPIAFVVGYIFYLKQLGDSIKKLGNTITNMFDNNTLIGKLKGATDSIKGFFSTLSTLYTRSNFINTAKGIFYLASALGILAYTIHTLPSDEIWAAAGALSILVGVVLGVNLAMAEFSNIVNPQGMVALGLGLALLTASMLGLAGAVAAVAGIIYVVSKSTGDLESAFMAMMKPLEVLIYYTSAALLGLLAVSATLAIIGAMAPAIAAGSAVLVVMAGALSTFSGALIGISIAANIVAPLIGLLVGQITAMYAGLTALVKKFTDFESVNDVLVEVLKGMGLFVAIVAAAVVSIGLMAVGTTAISAIIVIFSAALLGLALALGVTGIALNTVIDAIDRLSQITIPEASESMYALIATLMKASGEMQAWSSLGVATILIGLAAALKIIGPAINSVAPGILMLTAAAIGLSLAIKMWADIPAQQLLDGMLLIAAGIFALATAVNLMDGANIGKVAGGIMALVIGLYMLTPIIALYGVAWPVLSQGLGLVAVALIALAKAVEMIGSVKGTDVFLSVAAILSALLGMTIIIIQIGDMLENHLSQTVAGFAGLVTIMLSLAGITKIMMSIVNGASSWKQFAIIVGVMAGAVIVLGTVMGILSTLPVNAVMTAGLSLLLAMSGFALAAYALAQATNVMNSANVPGLAVLLGVLAASMVATAASLNLIKDVPWGVIIAFFVGFGGAVAGVTWAMSEFGAKAAAGIPVMGMIALIAATLAAVWWAVSLAITAVTNGIVNIMDAFGRFIPIIQSFITYLSEMSDKSDGIKKIGSALGDVGKNLISFGAGMGIVAVAAGAMSLALVAVGFGLTQFSTGLVVAGSAIAIFGAGVATAIESIKEPIQEAVTWGFDLVNNIATGMVEGIGNVTDAAMAVAHTIWEYLHQSVSEKGDLVDTDQWGFHLVGINIPTGMIQGLPTLSSVCDTVGSVIKNGITSGTEGTGSNIVSGIIGELANSTSSFSSMGATHGSAYMSAFLNQLRGVGGFNADAVAKGRAKRTGKYADYNFNRDDDSGASVVKSKNAKNNTFDIKDFLPDSLKNLLNGNGSGSNTKPTKTDGGGGGGAGGGGKGGSGSAKENTEALKKQAEAEKIHAKYVEYSTKVAKQYDEVYGDLNKTLGDTKPSEAAQNAIKQLADNLYKASLTGNETEEELAEVAKNTEKVFVEMYENIKKKTSESMDFFKEFDNHISEVIKPKQLMKNINSQISGTLDMASLWTEAAMRGFSNKHLKELIEKGAEGLGEIQSLLALNQKELEKYFKAFDSKDKTADFVASTGMTALALNQQVIKLKETIKTREEVVSKGKVLIDQWNEIQNSGAEDIQASLNMVGKAMAKLSEESGISVADIQKAAIGGADTLETQAERELKTFNKLSEAYHKWSNEYQTESKRMEESLKDFLTSFEKFEVKDDEENKKTADDMIEAMEENRETTKHWLKMINDLAGRGFNADKLREYVSAGVESSYQEVEAWYNASDDQIDKINELLEGAAEDAKNAGIVYGQNMANGIVGGIDAVMVPYFEQAISTVGTKFNLDDLIQAAGVQFNAIGELMGTGVKSGIDNTAPEVQNAATNMSESVDHETEKYINKENGYSKAENFMLGILAGIDDYKDDVLTAIDNVCSAVGDAVETDWEIHSPSHLTRRFAGFFMKGFINGFKQYGYETVTTVKDELLDPVIDNLKTALSTAYDILTTEADMSPTITPVLDLSNIQSGSKTLSSLMSNTSLQIGANLGTVNTPTSNMQALRNLINQNNNPAQNAGGNNYNFVQNNYSPKALSRLDIYRQTKNQFAHLKGLIN